MDQNQNEDQVQNKFNKKQFLMKRILQVVLSVSVFSVFVWYSSGFSILPQSFNAYFSTCLFSIFTHTLERKYMFLICNGILAVVAKTSLASSSASTSDSDFDQFQASNQLETKAPVSDMVVVPLGSFESPENVPLKVNIQAKWQDNKYNEEISKDQEEDTLYTKSKGRESEAYIVEEEEIKGEDDEGEEESGVVVVQDDELEETTITTNEDLANTDELNRKFEEFIRKMKEEIRIEARRQLIAV